MRVDPSVGGTRQIIDSNVGLTIYSLSPLLPVNSLRTFIEDIDAADGENPQLCAEYVKDIYEYLRLLERQYAVKAEYLAPTVGSKTKPEINGKMRSILIDWLIQVLSAKRVGETNGC